MSIFSGMSATDQWADIRRQIDGIQAYPVDLRAAMSGNPNEVNPGPGVGGGNIAWGNVPGLEQFYSYDIGNNQENFDMQSALPVMEQMGYQVMQGFTPDGDVTGSWVVGPDGQPIVESARLTGTKDDRFKLAALAAMGVTGANVIGAGFGVGGAAQAGASGLPAAVGQQPMNMAMIESGLGTPGYGYNAAAAAATNPSGALMFDPSVIGSGAKLMFGAGGEIIPYAADLVSAGGSAWDAAMAMEGAGIPPAAATPDMWSKIVNAATSLGKTVGDVLKDFTLLQSLLGTGAALLLSKEAEVADPDPLLVKGAEKLEELGDKTETLGDKTETLGDTVVDRADTQSNYFDNTFLPRYLEAMDEQTRRGNQLYDFQMGLARKYDQDYWNNVVPRRDSYWADVDSYASGDNINRMRGQAAADVERSNSSSMQGLARQMQRASVNPNAGVWSSNLRQMGQQGALNKALAMNMAGEAARREGIDLKGRALGMAGTNAGTAGGYANNAAGTAGIPMQGINAAQNGWGANNAGWNATTGLGGNMYGQAGSMYGQAGNQFGQIGNWGMGLTNNANSVNMVNTGGFNSLIGYGLGRAWTGGKP